jgi:nitronate monooxygenase
MTSTPWPDRRILDLFGVALPIVQAPMAGSSGPELAIAVSEAGGLGSLPCAMLTPEQARSHMGIFRQRTARPVNLNFFCHTPVEVDEAREAAWRKHLRPYYAEYGIDPEAIPMPVPRGPFNEALCEVVVETRPEVVSFHFGLPESKLLERVRKAGSKIICSATTVEEARRLDAAGCDAIIAQGYEAGGHRGVFLNLDTATQAGIFALVPQVVDAVGIPVIAAGGIADGRGIAAALALGASAVQMGSAYLRSPEALTDRFHRELLAGVRDDNTVLTNILSGRPARAIVNRFIREVGPMSAEAPAYPLAANAAAPIRDKAEAQGSADFSYALAGQAAALAREMPASELTRKLAAEAAERLRSLAAVG